MSGELQILETPYRVEVANQPDFTVRACQTCRFRKGYDSQFWRCGARGGVPVSKLKHIAEDRDCALWRQRPPRRSLLRWFWDAVLSPTRGYK